MSEAPDYGSTPDEILGPMCPDCGWRGGQHRPRLAFRDDPSACPRWTPTAPATESIPAPRQDPAP